MEPSDTCPGVVVGAAFDASLAAQAEAGGWDAFGEKGEFHSVAELWAEGQP
jgi:hypothetical protein